MKLSDRLQAAVLAAKVVRSTRVLSALRPAGLSRFVRAARGGGRGPHLITMLHAHTQPDKECLVDGDRRVTWGELDAQVNQLAHALVDRGVRPGDRVAMMLPNGIDYLVAQQTMFRIGAMAVQIGSRLKAPEVAYILDNAEPRVLLGADEFADVIAAAAPRCEVLRLGSSWDAAVAGKPTDRAPRTAGSGEGGVIVYTSGTTGKPKGAARSFKQTGFEAAGELMLRMGMRADDRHLVVCPLYHSAAPAFVAMMMGLGATSVLMNHFDAEAALALIARERITCAFMVPTMLGRMAALPAEVRAKHDTSSLRWLISGAAPLATETARAVQAWLGPILWNFYGATETGLVTLAGPADHVARPGTIGRALRGNEIRVLGDDGAVLPPGEIGELYARNGTLIAGYHRNDDATRSAMRDGFFSVGDLARVDADGFYYLESRKHDMVISGGVNIYPREIEDRLHTHPAVLEAAVIGVPDPDWGESLCAFVVARAGAAATEAELVAWCRETLADYKKPRRVVFLDELPRNPTGKVLKRELRERA